MKSLYYDVFVLSEMNPAAIGVHAAQQSAQMALGGEYTTSRLNAFMYQRLFHRNA